VKPYKWSKDEPPVFIVGKQSAKLGVVFPLVLSRFPPPLA
jgi:hypothetical protein